MNRCRKAFPPIIYLNYFFPFNLAGLRRVQKSLQCWRAPLKMCSSSSPWARLSLPTQNKSYLLNLWCGSADSCSTSSSTAAVYLERQVGTCTFPSYSWGSLSLRRSLKVITFFFSTSLFKLNREQIRRQIIQQQYRAPGGRNKKKESERLPCQRCLDNI